MTIRKNQLIYSLLLGYKERKYLAIVFDIEYSVILGYDKGKYLVSVI